MDKQKIIQTIKQYIFQNTQERISGDILQSVLLDVVDTIFSDEFISDIEISDNDLIIHKTDGSFIKHDLISLMPENSIAEYSMGDIKRGDDLSNQPIDDILCRMLIGPIVPKIITFKYLNNESIIEIGNDIVIGTEFIWNYNTKQYLKNSTIFTDLITNTILLQNTDNSKYVVHEPIKGLTSIGDYKFKVQVSDINNKNYDSVLNIKFGMNFYYKSMSEESFDESLLKQMNNICINEFKQMKLDFVDEGYKYLIIPKVLDKKFIAKNINTGFEIPFNKLNDITINNKFGLSNTYCVYRTSNYLTNPIKVNIYNE